ncbi:IclR family transcriptional regulator [Pseudodonghicola flavimaris]|uniref:IclR family transcriptional regulator n=1 Tax=Pseudodonghicola flavimaris TaxID=3050036 RepID=A0ABT7F209_9RHOB|nr:IclR family transcriptional regulator [Pseudodonghicola flavimaris]MDK3018627.1 IclR family transcriptional regulator [Pseudodonghicola flavimaris]
MAVEKTDKSDTIQSVAMALQVLETLANGNGDMGVTALASALNTTKSRIHRHLRTLVSLGYISQSDQTERYRIGARLVALGQAASGSAEFTSIALPHMKTLRDRTGQAVSLGQVEANGIRILNTQHGNMQIEVGVKPGSLLDFCSSAQGKVALAAMSAERRDKLIPPTIDTFTEYTITDRAELLAHIDEVARQGWATAPNETMLGLNALACPILNIDGEPVATIAIVSLTQYIKSPPDDDQVAAVKEAANQISVELGYTP